MKSTSYATGDKKMEAKMYTETAYDVRMRVRKRRRKIAGVRHARLNRRSQLIAVIMCIGIIAVFGGYIGAQDSKLADTGLAYTAQAAEEMIYKNIVVKSGDTVWGIASLYTEDSKDVRKTVKEICALNEIEPESIYPGQVIKVAVPAHMM